jgi:exodeoxyribonuclease V alpha subunit
MNGEVGVVIWVASEREEAEMKAAQRRGMADLFSLEKPPESSDPFVLQVDFGDRTVWFTREDLKDLRLAYAITIHKSQGSEFPAVIMIVPHLWPAFELRQLIYTGVTRAKKYCLVITPYGAIEKYIKNEKRLHRNTKLAKRLLEG